LTIKNDQSNVISLRRSLRAERSIAMMFRRIFGVSLLIAAFTFVAAGFASAFGFPGGGRGFPAPELDPTAIGSGLALLAGGVLVLAERRRAGRN
jgi:hypothetical protein